MLEQVIYEIAAPVVTIRDFKISTKLGGPRGLGYARSAVVTEHKITVSQQTKWSVQNLIDKLLVHILQQIAY